LRKESSKSSLARRNDASVWPNQSASRGKGISQYSYSSMGDCCHGGKDKEIKKTIWSCLFPWMREDKSLEYEEKDL
jgi:hypothetical protein